MTQLGGGAVWERWRGSAAAFHAALPPDDGRARIWSFEVDRPAVVLGSRQTPAILDLDRCRADGVEVVVRRSGGGAVLLEPGTVHWVDLVVPPWHPWWRADVRAAMVEVGRAWAEALDGVAVEHPGGGNRSPLRVHDGPMVHTAWSELICFEGIGPGEVLVGETGGGVAKVVGISQRRTRAWARFQCAVHTAYDPERLVRYLARPLPPEVAAVAHAPVAVIPDAAALGASVGRLAVAFGAPAGGAGVGLDGEPDS